MSRIVTSIVGGTMGLFLARNSFVPETVADGVVLLPLVNVFGFIMGAVPGGIIGYRYCRSNTIVIRKIMFGRKR